VSLQAHADKLEILADQTVQILSVNDSIRIEAQSKIEIVAGDSKITLQGSNIELSTSGSFEVKSSTHNFLGGGSGSAKLPSLPQANVELVAFAPLAAVAAQAASSKKPELLVKNDEQFRLVHEVTGAPLANVAYRIKGPNGPIRGRTDKDGRSVRVFTGTKVVPLSIEYFFEDEPPSRHRVSDDDYGC